MTSSIKIDRERIVEFCRRWGVSEFALFGSVLREDFGPKSDVDVLVTFAPEAHVSLLDLVEMEETLTEILGRKVDLVCKEGVEQSHNYIRKRAILGSAEVLYAA